ncbi:hypothetical protein AYI68_g851 [Smittium mucronatum]|uniref:Uncharacterized protein n=1 Tax=Smittium mucronatum TaxID=133383 RepID=A0A1R0H775_9FUNG|nr:hypothetical protein AYI68_g851 [Smittium mucronatum]
MGMVKRNHDLVESGAYPYCFTPEVEAWREVAEDRDSEVSASISIEALEVIKDLDPSVNLAGELFMEDLVSSLLLLSLSSGHSPPLRFSPIIPTVGAVQTLSFDNAGSNEKSVDRWCKGAIPALKSLLGEGEECTSDSVLGVASSLAAQQQFRTDNLYQSLWYRESSSEAILR